MKKSAKDIGKATMLPERKQPTYEGTDEFRPVKDIPKKELKARIGKKSPAKMAPLVAMAGKAILGKVAGKVANKVMEEK